MANDLVSVVIPYYNHKDYIEELLISIQKQTYKNIETILINDGSTDGSERLLESLQATYKFHFISTTNKGVCSTINRGLRLSKGKYIMLIGSDDAIVEGKIKDQVEILANNPYDAVGGGMTLMAKDSTRLRYLRPRKVGILTFDDVLFNNPVYAPSMMFRASCFKTYGFYDPSNPIDDYSMLLNMTYKGARIANFDKNWAYYRISHQDYLKKAKWYFEGIMATLEKYEKDPRVHKAKNYHRYLYLVRRAIFLGIKDRKAFGLLLQNKECLMVRILRYSSLILIALLPRLIRTNLGKMIVYKSSFLITLTNLLRF